MKHLEGQFKGCDGLEMYYQGWLPDYKPKAVLLVVHGLGEHSGRYGNLVNHFVPAGCGVYGYDQRGHGKSDGVKGYVNRFADFSDDLDIVLKLVRRRHPKVKDFPRWAQHRRVGRCCLRSQTPGRVRRTYS